MTFLTLKRVSPQPGIKANIELHFNLRSVLPDFLFVLFVIESAFAHPNVVLKTVWIVSL